MKIYLDLGNTNLYIGVMKDEKVVKTFRTATDLKKSPDEYAAIFSNFLKLENIEKSEIQGVVVSSVVPPLNSIIKSAIYDTFGFKPIIVGSGVKTGLPIVVDNPNEVGADLICDSVGAIAKYGYPSLIADLGTASKIIVVDDKGNFAGVIIMPGLKITMLALAGNTANLPEVSFEAPKKYIGKNTPDAINSGLIYGHVAMIEGLIKNVERELGYKCKHIITGGYGKYLENLLSSDFIFDKHLIFKGLDVIYNKNGGKNNER